VKKIRYNTKDKISYQEETIDVISEMQRIGIKEKNCIANIHSFGRTTCWNALIPGKKKTGQGKIISFNEEITRLKGKCEDK